MFKQLMIGLFAIGAVVMWQTEANALCVPLGNGTQLCDGKVKGSGMPTVLVTQLPGANNVPPPSNNDACPAVETTQGDVNDPFITLTLAGTVGTDCGLGETQNRECDIKGVAVCSNKVKKNVTTPGPLGVGSPGFAQTDGSTNSANFRFQLDPEHQTALCDGSPSEGVFLAFFAREAFFESCIDDFDQQVGCVQEFCKTDDGGIGKDEIRVYNCKPV